MLKRKLIITALSLFLLAGAFHFSPSLNSFYLKVNSHPVSLDRTREQEQLMEYIKNEAKKRVIPPINAKVDRVWKAIPGYNGLEVDIEQTYQKALTAGRDGPISFVYKEIPPQIQLDDLGPYPIYKGNPQKPMAALMINVAWGNEYIPKMLDILHKEQVEATFFFDGSWLSKNIETAREIQKQGHELSNHAYSHKNMSRLNREQAIEEIGKTQKILKEHLHVDNSLFAPPSGDFNEQTVKIAYEMKLKTILWTIDTVDWKNPQPDSIVRKISSRIEPGSLILMHPTRSSSSALEGMIKAIKEKHLQLGTVSELISPKRVPEASGSDA